MTKKILISVRTLNPDNGGVQNQVVEIANALSDLGVAVVIVTIDKIQKDSKNLASLGKLIRIHELSDSKEISNQRLSLVGRLKRIFLVFKIMSQEKPDLVLAFMLGAFSFSIISALLLRIPIYLCERNSPSMYTQKQYNNKKIFYFFTFSSHD